MLQNFYYILHISTSCGAFTRNLTDKKTQRNKEIDRNQYLVPNAIPVHGHYSAFLLLDISSSWSLLDVSVTRHVQSMTITLRFSYSSAFPSHVKTLYSTFQLLGVSRLPSVHCNVINSIIILQSSSEIRLIALWYFLFTVTHVQERRRR